MKKVLILALFALVGMAQSSFAQAPVVPKYEYMQVTTVESLVAGGLGRSRMISTDPNGKLQELPLENFFSLGGINFSNIRNNDKMITDKMNELAEQGWEVVQVSTGATDDSGKGIFISRYLLRRPKK
jgi:hypothetical protein